MGSEPLGESWEAESEAAGPLHDHSGSQQGLDLIAAELGRRVGTTGEVLIERPGRGRAAFYAAVDCAGDLAGSHRMRFVGVAGDRLIGVPV